MTQDGILYEPRSLWSVRAVATASFLRQHFLNGERNPITITRMAAAPLGNVLRTNYDAAFALMSANMRVILSAPQRQHYNRYPIPLSFAAPRSQPPVRPLGLKSSLWGVSSLDFDKPLYLPKRGSIELGITGSLVGGDAENVPMRFSALFQAEGGLATGSSRLQPPTLMVKGTFAPTGNKFDDVISFPAAVFDDATLTQGANGTFPPTLRLNTRTFDQQNAVRAGSERITRLAVLLDQIDADDVESSAPLALNVGSVVRTSDGGSGQRWWRPGAPLALVLDSTTPAFVYPLPEPITLGPGDSLDVEVEFVSSPFPVLGISFNGYAAIEG